MIISYQISHQGRGWICKFGAQGSDEINLRSSSFGEFIKPWEWMRLPIRGHRQKKKQRN